MPLAGILLAFRAVLLLAGVERDSVQSPKR
jgi:hypothetical protein